MDKKLADIVKNMAYSEILPSPLKPNPDRFINELGMESFLNDIRRFQKNDEKNYTYFYDDTIIKDDEIPNSYKTIGAKITTPQIPMQVELVRYPIINKVKGFVVKDVYGEKMEKPTTLGIQFSSNSDIAIPNYVYICKNEDAKDFAKIFSFSNKRNTFFHELKHARNNAFTKARNANPNSGSISPENLYRLLVDDEISANIDATFKIIDYYFKNGEHFDDLKGICPDVYKDVNSIKKKVSKKGSDKDVKNAIKKYLVNSRVLIISISSYWNERGRRGYDKGNFVGIMEKLSKSTPTHKISNNPSTNESEYLHQRRLLLTFDRYNPDTGKTEYQNHSSSLSHSEIPFLVRLKSIAKFKKTIKERRAKLTPEMIKNSQMFSEIVWENYKKDAPVYPDIINEKSESSEDKFSQICSKCMKHFICGIEYIEARTADITSKIIDIALLKNNKNK